MAGQDGARGQAGESIRCGRRPGGLQGAAMNDWVATPTLVAERDLYELSGIPVVYHCHHFNLFLDQVVDDGI